MLGQLDIGKTCFIRQFIDNEFPAQTKPTISVDFVTKTYQVDEFSVRLNIFDTAGQERHRALTKAYFKGTDAVLFMYSMDRYQSDDAASKASSTWPTGSLTSKKSRKAEMSCECWSAPRKICSPREVAKTMETRPSR